MQTQWHDCSCLVLLNIPCKIQERGDGVGQGAGQKQQHGSTGGDEQIVPAYELFCVQNTSAPGLGGGAFVIACHNVHPSSFSLMYFDKPSLQASPHTMQKQLNRLGI